MENSRRIAIQYVPRMTDLEAYERLDPVVRYFLKYAVSDFNAYSLYRWQKKHGVDAALQLLREWNEAHSRAPWIPARGRRKAVPNPCVAMKVSPITTGIGKP